jgi:hypothetical protein
LYYYVKKFLKYVKFYIISVYIKKPNIPVSLDIKELIKLSFPWHRCCYTIKQIINIKAKPVVKQGGKLRPNKTFHFVMKEN